MTMTELRENQDIIYFIFEHAIRHHKKISLNMNLLEIVRENTMRTIAKLENEILALDKRKEILSINLEILCKNVDILEKIAQNMHDKRMIDPA